MEDRLFTIQFTHSGETGSASLLDLVDCSIWFFDELCAVPLVDKRTLKLAGKGDGRERFARYIQAAGYKDDPAGFFTEVLAGLARANYRDDTDVTVNGIRIPYHLLIFVLERLVPGNGVVDVKSATQLEKLLNARFTKAEKDRLKEVLTLYPVRFSWHTVRQMRLSPHVAYQYIPFVEELDPEGFANTWVGQFHKGIVEQMYANRIIYVLNMKCPVYCRFCFRKHKDCREGTSPKIEDVREAVAYLRGNDQVKEVVLTGGDPFMNRATLTAAIEGALSVPHVQTLRVATRSVSYFPHLFYADNHQWLQELRRYSLIAHSRGKKLEIATHFIHPDEVSVYSLDVIADLVRSGIPVYIQTPLLANCNDSGDELVDLYTLLRGVGAEIHYIFMPCSPIHGNQIYRSPISSGLNAAIRLRQGLVDRGFPHICTATAMGKIDWQTSGWAMEEASENGREIWIRTPYTEKYFAEFAPGIKLRDNARVNQEGTLDLQYSAPIGDRSLLRGQRKHFFNAAHFERRLKKQRTHLADDLARLQTERMSRQVERQSIVPTGVEGVYRVHRTRVEVDLDNPGGLKGPLDYIQRNTSVREVVVAADCDAITMLSRVAKLADSLRRISHIRGLRIRSYSYNYRPERFSKSVIEKLGSLNHLTVTRPLRVELETSFLHADEFRGERGKIVSMLRQKGVTVYNNTPLLAGINDTPEELRELAYHCRRLGVEFHHLYVAGLPLQLERGKKHPVDLAEIPDIASYLRLYGSGRELPRYIIRTPLGEVDSGLSSRILDETPDGVEFKLLPYTPRDFQFMKKDFEFPPLTRIDADGSIVATVGGVKISKQGAVVF